MKILHVIFSLNIGGAENMLVDILNEQIKTQEVGLLIINKEYNTDLLNKLNPKVTRFLLDRKRGSRNPVALLKFNSTIMKFKPEVFHSHDYTAIRLLKCCHPYIKVLTVHDVGFSPVYFKRYDKLFAISKAVQKDIFDSSGLESVIIHNGIHLNSIKTKTSKANDRFRIVQVSRLAHLKKGQHILLEAVSLLIDKYGITNFSLDFIGSGGSETYLKELVKAYKLEKQVNFLGERSREEIYNNLCHYDLLVQPSLFEGFGLTVAEAMAAKVPVLVSANDGPMEIIDNGKYGFWFKKEDAQHCCEQIKQIMTHKDELCPFLENAYSHIAENFDIAQTANRYIQLYEK